MPDEDVHAGQQVRQLQRNKQIERLHHVALNRANTDALQGGADTLTRPAFLHTPTHALALSESQPVNRGAELAARQRAYDAIRAHEGDRGLSFGARYRAQELPERLSRLVTRFLYRDGVYGVWRNAREHAIHARTSIVVGDHIALNEGIGIWRCWQRRERWLRWPYLWYEQRCRRNDL